MKLLAIIADGENRIRIEATRAPDLRRREISARTGSADLVFAAVPPLGQSAEQFAVKLKAIFNTKSPVDPDTIRRIAAWHVYVKPRLQRVIRKVRKRLLRILRLQRTAPIPDPAH